jgi:uncharacterized membrane protein
VVEAFIILGPTFASRNVQGPATTDMYVVVCRGGLCLHQFMSFYVPFFQCTEKTPYLPTLLLIA